MKQVLYMVAPIMFYGRMHNISHHSQEKMLRFALTVEGKHSNLERKKGLCLRKI